ncbi:ORF1214 [White spot syndrome virus]|uniref:ORF1214 n=1 Tax=White spot syndrome virus TaxID=342409 RepID=A0A2D3I6A9_9VIRU|nr:ORF1214 [White spot syndrome virus]
MSEVFLAVLLYPRSCSSFNCFALLYILFVVVKVGHAIAFIVVGVQERHSALVDGVFFSLFHGSQREACSYFTLIH